MTPQTRSAAAIRVYLVEDNVHFARELLHFISGQARLCAVGYQALGRPAVTDIQCANPDVVVVDLGLPDMSGADLIASLRKRGFRKEILVLTAFDDDESLLSAFKAGAMGYIVKSDADFEMIAQAVIDIVKGEAPMSSGLARRILSTLCLKPAAASGTEPAYLSQREHDILLLLSRGYTPKKAAQALSISYETIRSHQKHIYQKLHVNSVVEAVAVYHRCY